MAYSLLCCYRNQSLVGLDELANFLSRRAVQSHNGAALLDVRAEGGAEPCGPHDLLHFALVTLTLAGPGSR
jgi:hypothetical protein